MTTSTRPWRRSTSIAVAATATTAKSSDRIRPTTNDTPVSHQSSPCRTKNTGRLAASGPAGAGSNAWAVAIRLDHSPYANASHSWYGKANANTSPDPRNATQAAIPTAPSPQPNSVGSRLEDSSFSAAPAGAMVTSALPDGAATTSFGRRTNDARCSGLAVTRRPAAQHRRRSGATAEAGEAGTVDHARAEPPRACLWATCRG